MKNYSLVVTPFKARSLDDYIKPFALATEYRNNMLLQMQTYIDGADTLDNYMESQKDTEAYQLYKQFQDYKNSILDKVFSDNNPVTLRDLLNLHGLYKQKIDPIAKAVELRQKKMAEKTLLMKDDPSIEVQYDPDELDIDYYIKNPASSLGQIKSRRKEWEAAMESAKAQRRRFNVVKENILRWGDRYRGNRAYDDPLYSLYFKVLKAYGERTADEFLAVNLEVFEKDDIANFDINKLITNTGSSNTSIPKYLDNEYMNSTWDSYNNKAHAYGGRLHEYGMPIGGYSVEDLIRLSTTIPGNISLHFDITGVVSGGGGSSKSKKSSQSKSSSNAQSSKSTSKSLEKAQAKTEPSLEQESYDSDTYTTFRERYPLVDANTLNLDLLTLNPSMISEIFKSQDPNSYPTMDKLTTSSYKSENREKAEVLMDALAGQGFDWNKRGLLVSKSVADAFTLGALMQMAPFDKKTLGITDEGLKDYQLKLRTLIYDDILTDEELEYIKTGKVADLMKKNYESALRNYGLEVPEVSYPILLDEKSRRDFLEALHKREYTTMLNNEIVSNSNVAKYLGPLPDNIKKYFFDNTELFMLGDEELPVYGPKENSPYSSPRAYYSHAPHIPTFGLYKDEKGVHPMKFNSLGLASNVSPKDIYIPITDSDRTLAFEFNDTPSWGGTDVRNVLNMKVIGAAGADAASIAIPSGFFLGKAATSIGRTAPLWLKLVAAPALWAYNKSPYILASRLGLDAAAASSDFTLPSYMYFSQNVLPQSELDPIKSNDFTRWYTNPLTAARSLTPATDIYNLAELYTKEIIPDYTNPSNYVDINVPILTGNTGEVSTEYRSWKTMPLWRQAVAFDQAMRAYDPSVLNDYLKETYEEDSDPQVINTRNVPMFNMLEGLNDMKALIALRLFIPRNMQDGKLKKDDAQMIKSIGPDGSLVLDAEANVDISKYTEDVEDVNSIYNSPFKSMSFGLSPDYNNPGIIVTYVDDDNKNQAFLYRKMNASMEESMSYYTNALLQYQGYIRMRLKEDKNLRAAVTLLLEDSGIPVTSTELMESATALYLGAIKDQGMTLFSTYLTDATAAVTNEFLDRNLSEIDLSKQKFAIPDDSPINAYFKDKKENLKKLEEQRIKELKKLKNRGKQKPDPAGN